MSATQSDRRIVIVGASLAGTRLAEGLRASGHTGPIVLIGAEAELPYDRPPLSKDAMRSEWSDEDVERLRLASDESLSAASVELRLGVAATALDVTARTVMLSNGEAVDYDILVIATGAVARPSPWRPESGVLQLRTLDDARAIATQLRTGEPVVVVGGGFIGTEIAAAAVGFGCDVTVVDPVSEPMARIVGPEVAGHLVELHTRNGAKTRFGVGVTDIRGSLGDLEVELADGSRLRAAAAVVGIGSIPSTGWLEGSAIVVDNGVVTDAHLRAVGAPDVYAIGDVARWPHRGRGVDVRAEHWTNASDQARYLAAVLTQGATATYEPTDYVWSDQYDWKVHTIGWRDPDGASILIGDLAVDGRTAVVHTSAAGAPTGVVTVNWVRGLNLARRLLAAGEPGETIASELRRLA